VLKLGLAGVVANALLVLVGSWDCLSNVTEPAESSDSGISIVSLPDEPFKLFLTSGLVLLKNALFIASTAGFEVPVSAVSVALAIPNLPSQGKRCLQP
jgi:hypothetical protein